MGNTRHVILPTFASAEQLANTFSDFYITKVATMRSSIDVDNPRKTVLDTDVKFDGIPLEKFSPATHDEVKRIITNAPNKSRDFDPIPPGF